MSVPWYDTISDQADGPGVENDVLSSNGQPLESERKEEEWDLVHEELEKRVASGRSALLLLP